MDLRDSQKMQYTLSVQQCTVSVFRLLKFYSLEFILLPTMYVYFLVIINQHYDSLTSSLSKCSLSSTESNHEERWHRILEEKGQKQSLHESLAFRRYCDNEGKTTYFDHIILSYFMPHYSTTYQEKLEKIWENYSTFCIFFYLYSIQLVSQIKVGNYIS